MIFGSHSRADTTVLLDETWADGSRAETNLPAESATWVGIPASGGTATVETGALSMTQGTSNQKLWTYFRPDGNPLNLAVGQKLRATIEFLAQGALYSTNSRNFRFGLFHDPTNSQVLQDVNSDGGGTGNPWTDSTGYGVLTFLTNGATANAFQIGKRTALTNSSLLGSTGAYTFPSPSSSGGAQVVHQLDTLYTIQFELDYVSATQMDLAARISNSSGLLAQHTTSDNGSTLGTTAPYTTFDQLFFRFSSASGTADELEFRRLKIELETPGTSPVLAGDYNDDGVVDAADYAVWRKALAGGGSLANETATIGTVDEDDYLAWRANFGAEQGGGGSAAAVPEPAAPALLFALLLAASGRRGLRVSGRFLQE